MRKLLATASHAVMLGLMTSCQPKAASPSGVYRLDPASLSDSKALPEPFRSVLIRQEFTFNSDHSVRSQELGFAGVWSQDGSDVTVKLDAQAPLLSAFIFGNPFKLKSGDTITFSYAPADDSLRLQSGVKNAGSSHTYVYRKNIPSPKSPVISVVANVSALRRELVNWQKGGDKPGSLQGLVRTAEYQTESVRLTAYVSKDARRFDELVRELAQVMKILNGEAESRGATGRLSLNTREEIVARCMLHVSRAELLAQRL